MTQVVVVSGSGLGVTVMSQFLRGAIRDVGWRFVIIVVITVMIHHSIYHIIVIIYHIVYHTIHHICHHTHQQVGSPMCHWGALCHFHPWSFLSVRHALPSTGLMITMMMNDEPNDDNVNDKVRGDEDDKNDLDDKVMMRNPQHHAILHLKSQTMTSMMLTQMMTMMVTILF